MQYLPLTINGTDFSRAASRLGYSIVYQERLGANSGQMLDGSYTWDVVAWKAVITWEINALNSVQLAALTSAIQSNLVPVTFFDTRTNAVRSSVPMHATLSGASIGALKNSGGKWFSGATLTLTEA